MAVHRPNGGRPASSRGEGGAPAPNRRNAPPRGVKRQALQSSPRRGRNNPMPPAPPRDNPRRRSPASRHVPHEMHTRPPRRKQRRHGRRGRNYTYYYILVFVLFAIVFVVLANTVLFKCVSFDVQGTARYSAEEIIGASGLKKGDNLLHINAEKAQTAVEKSLAYIDSVEVKKSFPTKIKISVVEAEKWFQVEQDGNCGIISRGGKIIDNNSDSSLVKVKGYEAESLEVGGRISSVVEGKNGMPEAILEAADRAGLSGIKEIDISDRFSIVVNYQDRIRLELGNISDVEKKLNVAAGVIETQIAPTEEVLLNLADPDVVVCRALNADSAVNELPEIPTQTSETSQEESAENPSESQDE